MCAKPSTQTVSFQSAVDVLRVVARFLVPGVDQLGAEDLMENTIDCPGDRVERLGRLVELAQQAGIPLVRVDPAVRPLAADSPAGSSDKTRWPVAIDRAAFSDQRGFDQWCEAHGLDPVATRRAVYHLLIGSIGDKSVGNTDPIACAALHVLNDSVDDLTIQHRRVRDTYNRFVDTVSRALDQGKRVNLTYGAAAKTHDLTPCGIFTAPGNPNALYFAGQSAGHDRVLRFRFDRVVSCAINGEDAEPVPPGPYSRLPFQMPLATSPVPAAPALHHAEQPGSEQPEPLAVAFLLDDDGWRSVEAPDRRQGAHEEQGGLHRFTVLGVQSPLLAARWAIRKGAVVASPQGVADLQAQVLDASIDALRRQGAEPDPATVNGQRRGVGNTGAPIDRSLGGTKGHRGAEPSVRRLVAALSLLDRPDSVLYLETLRHTFGLSEDEAWDLMDMLPEISVNNWGDPCFLLSKVEYRDDLGAGAMVASGSPLQGVPGTQLRSLRMDRDETRWARLMLQEAGAPEELIQATADCLGDPTVRPQPTEVEPSGWETLFLTAQNLAQRDRRKRLELAYPGHGSLPAGNYVVEALDLYRENTKWYLYAYAHQGPAHVGEPVTFRVGLIGSLTEMGDRSQLPRQDAPHRDTDDVSALLVAVEPATAEGWRDEVGFHLLKGGWIQAVDHGTDYVPAVIVEAAGLLLPAGSKAAIAALCDRSVAYAENMRGRLAAWPER